ncbi:DNA adenine methylase [Oceaniradius stylonematis]|uniref:DNA adenine methylase n=1 Tax=Oceaniradius stylonematis TaxID=2184161 RepID=A0A3A8ASJ8_9HYPH|nr:DNA adenine methylase [Oceaniradius stylonematis]RKF08431.1 DNA adenine methylase [Oceaniradius stylonematis]
MNSLETINLGDHPTWRPAEAASPFRYPGGKGFLTGFLAAQLSGLRKGHKGYVEPFAGGAGAAMNLLFSGKVETVHLNDLDIRIYSAWKAILEENERFAEAIQTCDVSLKTWEWAKGVVEAPAEAYSFDLGFATFFMNRTSRSGIVTGSGPIGGYSQSGKWKLDARFYRSTIVKRVEWIGLNSHRIRLSRLPAIEFLSECQTTLDDERTLYFIDPPYVKIGSRLYLDGMLNGGHKALAEYLSEGYPKYWVMTYDDHPLVRDLYYEYEIRYLQVNYSLSRARKEKELLIAPRQNG